MPHLSARGHRSVFLLLSACSLALVAPAQTVKLNDRLPPTPIYELQTYFLAGDGTRAVYKAALGGVGELYSVPLDGSTPPVLLTGDLNGLVIEAQTSGAGDHVFVRTRTGGGNLRIFRVPVVGGPALLLSGAHEPDGMLVDPAAERVVYTALSTTGERELFSVPADGSSTSVKLSGAMAAGGDVLGIPSGVALSPDGTRVVYLADQDADEVLDLYSAPIDGGDGSASAVRLNLTRPLADVSQFRISWDSLGVVYLADQDTDNAHEIYAVRIDGSLPPVKRSGVLPPGSSISSFELSTASDRIVWRAVGDLYSVGGIAGGTPVKLNPASGGVASARVSADGSRVLYLALSGGEHEVYSVPSDGSTPAVQLTGPTHGISSGTQFRFAEGTDRALFLSDVNPTSLVVNELYSAPLDASEAAVRLHGTVQPGSSVAGIEGLLEDGVVLFRASLEIPGMTELFRAAVDGTGAPTRVNGPLFSGASVDEVQFVPGAARVAFKLRSAVFSVAQVQLFSALAAGGGMARLSPEQTDGVLPLDVLPQFQVSGDGNHVVYLGPEAPSGVAELHSALSDGAGRSVELNAAIATDLLANDFRISLDGQWVVHRVRSPVSAARQLHAARIDERRSAVRLDVAPVPENHSVEYFALTPDSTSAAFLAVSGTTGKLFLAPVDGSQPPELLDTPVRPSGLAISPDGAWIVVRETSTSIRSVPIDGHQGPVVLTSIGGFEPFAVSPDSSRVVYLRENGTGPADLHCVPIDGSAQSVQLTVSPPGLWGTWQISADSARVVYLMDTSGGRTELYSVPTTGGTSPVRLNGPLPTGGRVSAFVLDAGSARVVYSADQDTAGRIELYSAPIDGSAPSVKLSGVMPANHVVRSSPFLSTNGRVVFLIGDTAPKQLRSAPIDGSVPPVRLDDGLLGNEFRSTLQVTPDGTGVLYASEQYDVDAVELFYVPIDGNALPRVVSGPMPPGGGVEEGFLVNPDGDRVHYRADQDAMNVFELYTGWIQHGPRRAAGPGRTVVR